MEYPETSPNHLQPPTFIMKSPETTLLFKTQHKPAKKILPKTLFLIKSHVPLVRPNLVPIIKSVSTSLKISRIDNQITLISMVMMEFQNFFSLSPVRPNLVPKPKCFKFYAN